MITTRARGEALRIAKWVLRPWRRRRRAHALILLYHRVANARSDPWKLCVSPGNFRAQLEVLGRYCRVSALDRTARSTGGGPLDAPHAGRHHFRRRLCGQPELCPACTERRRRACHGVPGDRLDRAGQLASGGIVWRRQCSSRQACRRRSTWRSGPQRSVGTLAGWTCRDTGSERGCIGRCGSSASRCPTTGAIRRWRAWTRFSASFPRAIRTRGRCGRMRFANCTGRVS